MEITIVQAVLIGLWTGVCLSGMLLGIYTNRCLIMATGVGLILGDLPTGLAMGAVGELAFMGFGVSQGGSVPPNPMGPGIIERRRSRCCDSPCIIVPVCGCIPVCNHTCLHSNGRCQRHSDKSAGQ